MKNQVIIVNKRKYAVGLFWQPVAAGQNARNYARGLVRSVDKNMNLYAQYRSMVALGSRHWGQKSGMAVAAADVMRALTEYSSFLAMFELGSNYYMVAVRNGVVLEDRLFTSTDDARQAYAKLFDIPDWNALIAPASWAMPRAVERKLSELLFISGHVTLRPISRLRGRVVSVLLIVLFGMMMFNIFRGPIDEIKQGSKNISNIDPQLAEEYKRQIAEKNKELDKKFNIAKQTPPKPIVLPYNNLPDVAERGRVCYQAMGFLMQPVAGWNQVDVRCDEEFASVQFKRTFGTMGDFYMLATDLMPHSFVEEKNEDTIILRAALPDVKVVASQDSRDAETIVRDVTTLFQGMNTTADINVVSDTVTNGVETVQLNVVEIAASSKLVPMEFMKIFNDFGGVYMTHCDWNVAKRTWNYEVIIYAK